MRRIGMLVGTALLLCGAGQSVAQTLNKEQQIAAAVLAAPEAMRAGATVLGFDEAGKFITLRAGTNDMVCHGDDPKAEGFEVSCFHKSVQPYIARGRELRAQGVAAQASHQTRWTEMDQKKLALPAQGATQYILTGRYDAATGQVADSYLRWVVYTPYATPESTGLGVRGGESLPWLMYPGQAGSHIMIVPPRRSVGASGAG